MELTNAYSEVWIMIEQSTDADGHMQGPALSAVELTKLHGVCSSYGARCHVRQVYSERQLAIEIRAALEVSCGLLAEDAGAAQGETPARGRRDTPRVPCDAHPDFDAAEIKAMCSRDDLQAFARRHAAVEDESPEEAILANFPSLSVSSAQAVSTPSLLALPAPYALTPPPCLQILRCTEPYDISIEDMIGAAVDNEE